MAQETQPQIYPLLPDKNSGGGSGWDSQGKTPVSESPGVYTMQPIITVDNTQPTGSLFE